LEPAALHSAAGFLLDTRWTARCANLVMAESAKRGSQMSVLIVAFGVLAALWILVLLGSPFFGPRDH